jgi:hypothetical protein
VEGIYEGILLGACVGVVDGSSAGICVGYEVGPLVGAFVKTAVGVIALSFSPSKVAFTATLNLIPHSQSCAILSAKKTGCPDCPSEETFASDSKKV